MKRHGHNGIGTRGPRLDLRRRFWAGLVLTAFLITGAQAAPPFLRGDFDSSGEIDISDPIATLSHIFLGEAGPSCLDAADANDDGDVNITDPIFSLSFLFLGGSAFPAPFPSCGADPTPDQLLCDRYDAEGCDSSASPIAALAPSNHYVAVSFEETPTGTAWDAESYVIADTASGATLDVLSVLADEGDSRRVLLATASQKTVEYALQFGEGLTGGGGGAGQGGGGGSNRGITFQGSDNAEPFLATAIALSNTTVLLTYSEPVDEGALDIRFHRIAAPDLDILAAEFSDEGSPGTTVLLTTSSHQNVEYTVKVTNVKSSAGSFLIDPTRNTATFHGIPVEDSTAPQVTGAVSTSATTALLSFSEPLTEGAGNPLNYEITPSLVVTDGQLSRHNTQVLLTTLPQAANTEYLVVVSNVTDAAGNRIDPAANSARFSLTASSSLSVSSISPDSGPETGGTAVVIRGSGFGPGPGGVAVLFGGAAAASVEVVTDTLLTATTPPGPAGTVDVTIENSVGVSATAAGAFTYEAADPLTASGLAPAEGPVDGGTVVTVQGSGFAPGIAVLFGAVASPSVELLNGGLLTAVSPAQPGGDVDVRLVATDGREVSAGTFTYVSPPPLAIAGISPDSGPDRGGTLVTIEGVSFRQGTAVLFGSSASPVVEVFNEHVLTAVTPAHAPGDVDVRLIAPDGEQFTETAGFTFTTFNSGTNGVDSDGDGLSDSEETLGYEIRVDEVGFGMDPRFVASRIVFGDPGNPDSDGDGLDDLGEFLNRSDPQDPDTDGDGLTDVEEVTRWLTSPVSVDTDGDARGPNMDLPPNSSLFDGNELISKRNSQGQLLDESGNLILDGAGSPVFMSRLRVVLGGTSPTLDDTDGDGRTDYEEFDDPVRTNQIADLPGLEVEIVDQLVVKLNVEFADSVGSETVLSTTLSQAEEKSSGESITESTGTSIGTSEGRSDSSSFTDSFSTTTSVEESTTIGAGLEITAPPSLSVEGSITETSGFSSTFGTEFTKESTREVVETLEEESSVAASQEVSRSTSTQEDLSTALAETQERTEISSDGFVSLGVRLRNSGTFAFTMQHLVFALRYFSDASEAFETLATLSLADALDAGITLGPGQTSSVFQVSAQGLSASLILEFLARPNNLILEPSNFDLNDSQGINFAFLTENTFGRTALLVIDYGDGVVERFRVATNVDRSSDSSLAGIKLGRVFEDVLGLERGVDFDTEEQFDSGGNSLGRTVLTRLRRGDQDFETELHDDTPGAPSPNVKQAWIVIGSRDPRVTVPQNLDDSFEDIVLHNRDEVRVVFVRDEDRDGLNDREEYVFGSSDQTPHSDGVGLNPNGDTLDDLFETKVGWVAGIRWSDPANPGDPDDPSDPGIVARIPDGFEGPFGSYPRRVFSDPATTDADLDDLDDLSEFQQGTDPFNADTDGDSLPDAVDPAPLLPASRLFVDANVAATSLQDGSSWENAFASLEAALSLAKTNNLDADDANDVSEIWVARGNYQPSKWKSFEVTKNVQVYGGFRGFEGGRGERNSDPFTNGTTLSGNSWSVVTISPFGDAENPGSTTIVDGFTIRGGIGTLGDLSTLATILLDSMGGAIFIEDASPVLRNLFIADNQASLGGAIHVTGAGAEPLFQDCRITNNHGRRCDSGFFTQFDGVETFLADSGSDPLCPGATTPEIKGGALSVIDGAAPVFERCIIENTNMLFVGQPNPPPANDPDVIGDLIGGAIYVSGDDTGVVSGLTMTDCRISGTLLGGSASNVFSTAEVGGGVMYVQFADINLTRCVIEDNVLDASAVPTGGGVGPGTIGYRSSSITLNGCGIWNNELVGVGDLLYTIGPLLDGPARFGDVTTDTTDLSVVNCTVAANTVSTTSSSTYSSAIWLPNQDGSIEVRNSILWGNDGLRDTNGQNLTTLGSTQDRQIGPVKTCRLNVPPCTEEELTLVVQTTLIEGAQAPFGNNPVDRNIGDDPLFVDVASGDLRLSDGSPAIDAGDNSVDAEPLTAGFQPLPDVDLDGQSRLVDGDENGTTVIDLGAFEFQQPGD